MPSFRSSLRVGIIQVDGDHVVRLSISVSLWEKEYSPVAKKQPNIRDSISIQRGEDVGTDHL